VTVLRERPIVDRCPNASGDGTGLWTGYHCRQDATLQQRYGITCDQYWTYFEEQEGKCAVCKRKPTKRYRLVVDHDHDTGLIRGLIHARCNRWITRSVVRYIQKHPGQRLQIYVPADKMRKLEQLYRERIRKEHARENAARGRKKGFVAGKRTPERPSSIRSKLR
jgi:Recombination endonuclease VII